MKASAEEVVSLLRGKKKKKVKESYTMQNKREALIEIIKTHTSRTFGEVLHESTYLQERGQSILMGVGRGGGAKEALISPALKKTMKRRFAKLKGGVKTAGREAFRFAKKRPGAAAVVGGGVVGGSALLGRMTK
jgi:hypothetical protein